MPSFHFKGKSFLENYHHTVKFHKLKSQKAKGVSKSPSLTDNLLIHGDNLKALKALLPTHAGKVKCIYIDPPYNTGSEEWIYNDNVASPMIQDWLGKVVPKDDLTRHDKWACMMYPRLTLLKELLREDGVIFVSIDDNEIHRLRMLMDEIFGEDNFVACILWKKKTNPNNMGEIPPVHDYILVYRKTDKTAFKGLRITDEYIKKTYKNPDNDPRGPWRTSDLSANHVGPHFPIKNPKTGQEFLPPKGRYWVFNEEEVKRRIQDGRIIFGSTGKTAPAQKKFLAESSLELFPDTWWDKVAMNSEGTLEIAEILGHKEFIHPKPSSLLKRIFQLTTGEGDIILDSFAGSGTTAHAVLALNQEDGGNRKFILVECEDYADTITAERIRRVIKGVPNAKDEALQKGLGGSFSYYELGEELEMDKLLEGEDLPSFDELARYAFFTATGENWDESKKNTDAFYIGSSNTFEVFQLYTPDKEKLKKLALNLDFAMKIQERFPSRQKLVFAPACFMEEYHLKEFGIRFAQLPFEIYRMAE